MERIQADIGRFLKAVLLVKEKRGIVLDDGGYARAGRSSNWGGPRVKMELQAGKWVHTDAEDGEKALRSWGKWSPTAKHVPLELSSSRLNLSSFLAGFYVRAKFQGRSCRMKKVGYMLYPIAR